MLTVAYIVKDSILSLPESVNHTKKLTKNIIIVDTGSTDGTKEYAKSQASIYSEFDWCDDFSAARNYALGLCKTPWVLMLDSDEWIDEHYHQMIKSALRNKTSIDGFMFQIFNFIQDPRWIKKPMILYGSAVRLFRADRGFLYSGCLHERIETFKEIVQLPGVSIYHMQFNEQRNFKEKFIYFKKLMDRTIHKEGWTFLNHVYYADLYRKKYIWGSEIPDLAVAVDHLEKANAIDPENKIISQLFIELKGVLENVTKKESVGDDTRQGKIIELAKH